MKENTPQIIIFAGVMTVVGFLGPAWLSFVNATGYFLAQASITDGVEWIRFFFWAVPIGGVLAVISGVKLRTNAHSPDLILVTALTNVLAVVSMFCYYLAIRSQGFSLLRQFEIGFWLTLASCAVTCSLCFDLYRQKS